MAKSLKWAPGLRRLADKVVKAINAKGRTFNSLHLRLEKDARDWTEIMGGAQVWLSSLDCAWAYAPNIQLHGLALSYVARLQNRAALYCANFLQHCLCRPSKLSISRSECVRSITS